MARSICDRCPNSEALAPFGGFDLCPVCRYDAEQVMKAFVTTGRQQEVTQRAEPGERITQCRNIITAHGFVDSKLLARYTGLSRLKANEYLQTAVKKKYLMRCPSGARGRFVNYLAGKAATLLVVEEPRVVNESGPDGEGRTVTHSGVDWARSPLMTVPRQP